MKYEHIYQVLETKVTIRTDLFEVHEAFRYVSLNVEQEFEVTQNLYYEVIQVDGFYVVVDDGTEFATFRDPDDLTNVMFKIINTKSLDYMSSYIRIHSGSASYKNKYFLVVGDAYAGKTTFMTSLAFGDFDVHGDELTLLKDGKVVTYPRKLYIRDTSLGIIPELEELSSDLPYVWNTPTLRIFAFDPTVLGKPWNIEPHKVAAIFFLHKNHGNDSYLEECPKFKMVEQVMRQSTAPIKAEGNWVGDLCDTVNNCKSYNLHIGKIDQAMELIKNTLIEEGN